VNTDNNKQHNTVYKPTDAGWVSQSASEHRPIYDRGMTATTKEVGLKIDGRSM